MRRPSGTKPRKSGPTVLSTTAVVSAVPVLALVARPSSVDLASLSPGMAALAAGLVVSFLAPAVVATLLIATDDSATGSERATDDERSTARGTRSESTSATRADRSTDARRTGTRAHSERSQR